ncbi:hypothetical protein ANCCEY_09193 [Ancylostoma ceylanicum]|uniref:Uncharacterized protein n=1 Tax=Ancylostoma ceylanicum TaxID=53326 RepID=A0A0D6LNU7_9BILA|nr:hypothetical protein ANCCEY_09193 [Ancylostoma ceylanicum]
MSRLFALLLLLAVLTLCFAIPMGGALRGYGSYGPAWRRRLWRADGPEYDTQLQSLLDESS